VLIDLLTPEQVDGCLARGGEPLAALRAAVQQDPTLRELVQTPLMLGLLIGTYRGKPAEPLLALGAEGDQQRRLFAAYVDRMFARRGGDARYSREQTMSWLAWLAHTLQQTGQSVFLIERLQLDWLGTRARSWQYALSDRLGIGLAIGLASGLIYALVSSPFGMMTPEQFRQPQWGNLLLALSSGPIGGLIYGLMFGLLVGLFGGTADPRSYHQRQIGQVAVNALRGGLIGGLLGALMYGLAGGLLGELAGMQFGAVSGLVIGIVPGALIGVLSGRPGLHPRRIIVVETLRWSWGEAWRSALVFGVVFGLAFGVAFGLFGVLVSDDLLAQVITQGEQQTTAPPIGRADLPALRLVLTTLLVLLGGLSMGFFGVVVGFLSGGLDSGALTTTMIPNQGIWRSARHAVQVGIALGLISGSVFALFVAPIGLSAMVSVLVLNILTLGPIFALSFGGYACLSHLALRIVLWRSGAIPWNYAAFLDYCVGRVFLRKVGGGYIFVHRLLLEYFAALPDSPGTTATTLARSPGRTPKS
jgi:hypothetical protein